MTTNEFDKIPVGKRYTSKNSALTAMIPHLSNCDGLHLLLSGLYVSPFCLRHKDQASCDHPAFRSATIQM